ncbi:MAG: exodeoxyribonuclease VII small subunit [Anaerolineaceae bacterium]|nr:exodeoxyribonuclease VII small subunit [Anaerolineaceae bacterium]
MVDATPVEQMTYETAFFELEAIVAALEANQRPLEEAMGLFERGQSLAAHCSSLLDQAELKVHQLSGEDLLDEGGREAEA